MFQAAQKLGGYELVSAHMHPLAPSLLPVLLHHSGGATFSSSLSPDRLFTPPPPPPPPTDHSAPTVEARVRRTGREPQQHERCHVHAEALREVSDGLRRVQTPARSPTPAPASLSQRLSHNQDGRRANIDPSQGKISHTHVRASEGSTAWPSDHTSGFV